MDLSLLRTKEPQNFLAVEEPHRMVEGLPVTPETTRSLWSAATDSCHGAATVMGENLEKEKK